METVATKTKLQIIEETVEFYSNNPRSINAETEQCRYVSDSGANCAFSRCCTDEGKTILHKEYEGRGVGSVLLASKETFLKPEYKGHSENFWRDIQQLHDGHAYWVRNRLTEDGKKQVENLKYIYK